MRRRAWLLLLLLEGCSLAPDYQRPTTDAASVYREAGSWAPFDAAQPEPAWWTAWHDTELDGLEQRALKSNQNLQASLARLDQGRAQGRMAWSALWPSLSATALHTDTQISSHTSIFPVRQYPVFQTNQVGLDLNYELDLWGALRNGAHAADAQIQASAADLAALTLSTEAEIALDYEGIRMLDQELADVTEWVTNWDENRHLTQALVSGQEAAVPDQAQADFNWQSARQQLNELRLQRQQMEHGLAQLVGEAPERFHVDPHPDFDLPAPLRPGTGLPSRLLERRPDVVAAEARVRAANANVGVAKAAWFPVFSLTGNMGYGNTGYGPLLVAPNRLWSFGPSLSVPLLDDGLTAATQDLAQAQWRESVALYRQAVLGAWRDVEDQLTALHELDDEVGAAQAASEAAHTNWQQAQLRYDAGLNNRFEVLLAQRNAITARNQLLQLRLRDLTSSVLLIKALGGGWEGLDVMAKDAP